MKALLSARRPARLTTSLLLAAIAASGGCRAFDDFFSSSLPDDPDAFGLEVPDELPAVDLTSGNGLGDPCTPLGGGTSDCRLTLVCDDGVCKAAGTTGPGQFCVLTAECAGGLHCGFTGTCEPASDHGPGAPCTTAADCTPGLYCRIFGLSGVCEEAGSGDLDDPCEALDDCLAGLSCGPVGLCAPGNLADGAELWAGVDCTASNEDEGPPRVLFEIPRGAGPEFFRTPYPNDIRRSGGTVDLTGFPTPGPGVVGFDPVARLVDAAAEVQRGFSVVPTVVLRFSETVQTETIQGSPSAASQTLRFVNIEPDSPGYGTGPAYVWTYEPARSRYVCHHSMTLRVDWSTPLRADSTYAVYLTQGVRTPDTETGGTKVPGTSFGADDDFAVVMADEAPADSVEHAAWAAYAPLRAFLDAEGVPRADLLGAAVFRTEPTRDVVPAIRAAVHAAALPEPQDLVACGDGVTSPCDDGLEGADHVRGCFDTSAALWELHLRLDLPTLQQGTRPYLEPSDGGGLVFDDAGAVVLQGTEPVCVSVTLPKGQVMPEAGWPLMLYGHGTGGTFRSSVAQAGAPLADVTTAAGARVGVAVAGWDGPMHGDRRHAEIDPEPLFYHFGNAVAARGNVYQGAADLFALLRALTALELDADQSPTGDPIRFDAAHLAYTGHSQGASTGQLGAPYEPDLELTVWSGAGAGLKRSLLHKEQPVDAKQGLAVALQEVGSEGILPIDETHPVLGLLQDLFGPVDPVSHARLQLVAPLPEVGPQHVLHVYGLGDSFTPPETIEVFARLLGVAHVEPLLQEVPGLLLAAPPLAGNVSVGGSPWTGALIQAAPAEGHDGHFVLFDDAGVREQYRQFVATWLTEGLPVVVARPE